MVKYGSNKRFTGMTDEDLTLSHERLDHRMMETFQYEVLPVKNQLHIQTFVLDTELK
jgi:hypothetical protein